VIRRGSAILTPPAQAPVPPTLAAPPAKEEPGSGYELVGRLKDFGIDDERASVYRACRLALARNGESGAGCAQAALDGSGTSPQPGRPQPESFDQPPLTQRS
jgi:hypothetical protein